MNPPLLCAFSRFDGVFVSLFSITSIFPPCELRLSDRHPTKVGFHSLFTNSSQPFAASSQRILCPFITHHDHPHHSTHYPSTHPHQILIKILTTSHHILIILVTSSSHPHHILITFNRTTRISPLNSISQLISISQLLLTIHSPQPNPLSFQRK
jgi:hypothetical protein